MRPPTADLSPESTLAHCELFEPLSDEQVSALAVSGAEKLLKREIDANAHKALIDDLAAQL